MARENSLSGDRTPGSVFGTTEPCRGRGVAPHMATSLEMNPVKGTSFSMKTLLDLPEGKGTVVPCGSPARGDGSLDLSAPRGVGSDLSAAVSHFYDANDNPYTRWLQNNDHMQYGRKFPLSPWLRGCCCCFPSLSCILSEVCGSDTAPASPLTVCVRCVVLRLKCL